MAEIVQSKLRRIKVRNNVPSPYQPGRTLKMGMPICEDCQHGRAPQNWYETCPHNPPYEGDETSFRNGAGGNPYITRSELPVSEPVIEVNKETGEKLIVGTKTKLVLVETDNLTQVPYEMRSDSGKGLQMAEAGGYVLPFKLGIAPFCQYRECWEQEIRVRNAQFGDYCSEYHARLAIANILGKPLEVLDETRRLEQLQEISL